MNTFSKKWSIMTSNYLEEVSHLKQWKIIWRLVLKTALIPALKSLVLSVILGGPNCQTCFMILLLIPSVLCHRKMQNVQINTQTDTNNHGNTYTGPHMYFTCVCSWTTCIKKDSLNQSVTSRQLEIWYMWILFSWTDIYHDYKTVVSWNS